MRRWLAIAAIAAAALAACSPRFDWREIRRSEDRFAVALPDRPQTVVREVEFQPGDAAPRRVEMAMTSTGVGSTLFAVGAVRLPRELLADGPPADRAVAWLKASLLRNVNGTETTETALPPERLPRSAVAATRSGIELRTRGTVPAKAGGSGRPAELAARIYVADDRLYQLVVVGAEGELSPDTIDTFFSSFRLIE